MPMGTVEVLVVCAEGLKDRDMMSKADPYVIVHVDQQKRRTKTKDGAGTSPVFNEKFPFNVLEQTKEIRFQVFEANSFSSDELNGVGTMPFSDAPALDRWIDLYHPKTNKSAGRLHVVTYFTRKPGTGPVNSSSTPMGQPMMYSNPMVPQQMAYGAPMVYPGAPMPTPQMQYAAQMPYCAPNTPGMPYGAPNAPGMPYGTPMPQQQMPMQMMPQQYGAAYPGTVSAAAAMPGQYMPSPMTSPPYPSQQAPGYPPQQQPQMMQPGYAPQPAPMGQGYYPPAAQMPAPAPAQGGNQYPGFAFQRQ